MNTIIMIAFTVLLAPPPQLPPASGLRQTSDTSDTASENRAIVPRQVEDAPGSQPAQRNEPRTAVPHAPEAIKYNKINMLWSYGLHWSLQAGILTTTGSRYTAPSEYDIPSPPAVMAEVLGGVFWKFSFSQWFSLGFDLGLRTASPLPVMHAGIRFMADWPHWVLSLYIHSSELGASDSSEHEYVSRGDSIGLGVWYALPFSRFRARHSLFGVTWEYWSGTHYSGSETAYTDGPGTFTHKQLIMSLQLTW